MKINFNSTRTVAFYKETCPQPFSQQDCLFINKMLLFEFPKPWIHLIFIFSFFALADFRTDKEELELFYRKAENSR